MEDKELKITNEIINDAFWLSYVLELKRKIDDYDQKEILSLFLLNFSSVFVKKPLLPEMAGWIRRLLQQRKKSAINNDNKLYILQRYGLVQGAKGADFECNDLKCCDLLTFAK